MMAMVMMTVMTMTVMVIDVSFRTGLGHVRVVLAGRVDHAWMDRAWVEQGWMHGWAMD